MADQNAIRAQPQRVYLDVCALNRPLDDQNQIRIRLESDAVALILSHVRAENYQMIVTPVHFIEIAANPASTRREHVQALVGEIGTRINVDATSVRVRAEELIKLGLGVADAAHVAFAETIACDFVTVDDRLLHQLQRISCHVWFGLPTTYCEKEDLR